MKIVAEPNSAKGSIDFPEVMHDTDPMTFEHEVSITSSEGPQDQVRAGVTKTLLPALATVFKAFREELEKSKSALYLAPSSNMVIEL